MSERGMELVLTDEAKDFLIAEGLQPRLRCPAAPPCHREHDRKPARRRDPPRNAFKGKDLINVTVEGPPENRKLKFDATTKAEQEEGALVAVGSEKEASEPEAKDN